MDPQHPRRGPTGPGAVASLVSGPSALIEPANWGQQAPPEAAAGPHGRGPWTLARGPAPIDHASMAHLVHNLDTVAWAVLTALLVITAVALLGFLFLAAI